MRSIRELAGSIVQKAESLPSDQAEKVRQLELIFDVFANWPEKQRQTDIFVRDLQIQFPEAYEGSVCSPDYYGRRATEHAFAQRFSTTIWSRAEILPRQDIV